MGGCPEWCGTGSPAGLILPVGPAFSPSRHPGAPGPAETSRSLPPCGTGFPAGLWVFRLFCRAVRCSRSFSSAPIRGLDRGGEGAFIHGFRPDWHRDSTPWLPASTPPGSDSIRSAMNSHVHEWSVETSNNHAERSVRFLVIMRKICFGIPSPAGSESHSVLPWLLETARRQGKNRIDFLTALLTPPIHPAHEAFLRRNDTRQHAPIIRHAPASSCPRPRRAYAWGPTCYIYIPSLADRRARRRAGKKSVTVPHHHSSGASTQSTAWH